MKEKDRMLLHNRAVKHKQMMDELVALRAENERLRGVIEDLLDLIAWMSKSVAFDSGGVARQVWLNAGTRLANARAALEG